MARTTIRELLDDFNAELARRFDVDASVRWFRTNDQTEQPLIPAYYVEPGALSVVRTNVASPQVEQTIRFLSESSANYIDVPDRLAAELDFFEKVMRDFMREPFLPCGAFLLRATTFADAPSGFSVDAAESFCNVFGGAEFAFGLC